MSKYNYFDDDFDEKAAGKININPAELLKSIKAFTQKSERRIKYVAHEVAEHNPIENIPKSKKALICFISVIITVLIIIAIIFGSVHAIHQENKKAEDFNINASKICSTYSGKYGNCSYEGMYAKYDVNGYMLTGLCYARQMDFDNDGVSELLLCYNDSGIYYVEVWGFNNDKDFVNLYRGKANQTKSKKDSSWITLYHHSNKYYIGTHDEDDITNVSLLTLKNGKFTKKLNCTYDENAEEFSFKGNNDTPYFERIKLSVLREAAASRTTELVSDVIDGFGSYSSGKNVTSVSYEDRMKRAYYSVIQDYNQKYGFSKYVESGSVSRIDGLASVRLVDFDSNGKDELMLIYSRDVRVRGEDSNGNYVATLEKKYFCDVFAFNGENAVRVYENEGLSQNLNSPDDVYYILKYQNGKYLYCTNTFLNENYGRHIIGTSKIYSFDGESFVQKYKSSYESNYGYTKYYIDGDQVSKTTFDSQGYKVPLFDGSSKYDDGVYQIVYLKCRTSKAGDMKKEVDKTVSAIKELNSNYNPENN